MIKNNLSKILGERRMKQQELVDLSGVSYDTVSRIYHDRTSGIDFKVLDKFCGALNVSTSDILEFIDDSQEKKAVEKRL
jgi:putative transcriptional regulator